MEDIKELTCDIAECLLNNYGVCKCGSRNRGECDCNAVKTEPPEPLDNTLCVCCGAIIPEGLLVCPMCEGGR